MATVKEVVTDALEDILEQSADEPVEAADGETGIRFLNDMLFMWDAKGINLGFTRVTNMGETLSIADGAIMGVKAHLSIFLAPKFGAEVSPALINRAREGWRAILALTAKSATRQYPSILPMGSGNSSQSSYYSKFYPEVDSAIMTENGGLIALEINTIGV